MPLYEYQCQQCGTRLEALQKFSDDPLTECEACGGQLKKLISAPAVQFKGTGWYVTDYAGKSGGSSGKKSEGGDSKKEGGDSGKGDSSSSSSSSDSSSSSSSSKKESSSKKD